MEYNRYGRVLEHRCEICDQPIFTACDKTQKSDYQEMLTGRAKDPVSKHWFYPTNELPEKLCFHCKAQQKELKVGKFDGIEITKPTGNSFGLRKTIPHIPKKKDKDATDYYEIWKSEQALAYDKYMWQLEQELSF